MAKQLTTLMRVAEMALADEEFFVALMDDPAAALSAQGLELDEESMARLEAVAGSGEFMATGGVADLFTALRKLRDEKRAWSDPNWMSGW